MTMIVLIRFGGNFMTKVNSLFLVSNKNLMAVHSGHAGSLRDKLADSGGYSYEEGERRENLKDRGIGRMLLIRQRTRFASALTRFTWNVAPDPDRHCKTGYRPGRNSETLRTYFANQGTSKFFVTSKPWTSHSRPISRVRRSVAGMFNALQ